MKKLVSVVLCMVMMLSLLPVLSSPAYAGTKMPTGVSVSVSSQTAFVGDYLTWTINVDPPEIVSQTRVILRNFGIPYYSTAPYTTSNVHTHRVLLAGTTTAEAIGVDLADNVIASVISAETTVKLRPAPVLSSVVTLSGSSVQASWKSVADADGYKLWRSTAPAGPYTLRRTTTALTVSDTYLVPGTQYYYKVSAYLLNGGTKYDLTELSGYKVVVPLGKATITKVVAAGPGKLKLTFTAVPGATRYIIYRSASANGSYVKIGTSAALTYTSAGLTKGKNYYYKVKPYKIITSTNYYGFLSEYKLGRAK